MMRTGEKILVNTVFATVAILLVLSAVAAENHQNDSARWIVFDGNETKLEKMGYEIVHELNDAVVVKAKREITTQSLDEKSEFSAIPDRKYHIMDTTSSSQIDAEDVWSYGYSGEGVTVAVLDTGVDYDHSQLTDSYAGGYNFIENNDNVYDDNGHGTHVAGIITANSGEAKGVAPDADIWVGKVCNENGVCYMSDIAAAIEHVVEHDTARIISMSLGSTGTNETYCDDYYLAQKAHWAIENGVVVVAAAGNDPDFVSNPACGSEVIAVGAVDSDDGRASFSGHGKALDIMAPGVAIYSTLPDGGYGLKSGTSMATPHVSGVVALLLDSKPSLTPSEVRDSLYSTAIDLGDKDWDEYYGWGRIDAEKTINYFVAYHTYDENRNCVIDMKELGNAIEDWKTGEIPMGELMEVIKLWKSAEDCCA